MKEQVNVLVFPCNTEAGLEIHAALRYEKNISVFGAESGPAPDSLVFRRHRSGLPEMGEAGFDDALDAIVRDDGIQFIFPGDDAARQYLAAHRDRYSVPVIAPDLALCDLCRSPARTFDALLKAGVKIRTGQEDETTARVDCYRTREGVLLFSAAYALGTEEDVPAPGTPDADVLVLAEAVGKGLGLAGRWYMDLADQDGGAPKLVRVGLGGTAASALHRLVGVNLVLLELYEALGLGVKIPALPPFGRDSVRVSGYRHRLDLSYDMVYLDLDDTLIIDGRVNDMALLFLYQCRARGCPVRLITRHARHPELTLEAFHIHAGLFDEIIWITGGEPKSSVMEAGAQAIFIDDAFLERQDVTKTHGWPSFAPDSIEALLDWRR